MSAMISAIATLTCAGTVSLSASDVAWSVFWYFFTSGPPS